MIDRSLLFAVAGHLLGAIDRDTLIHFVGRGNSNSDSLVSESLSLDSLISEKDRNLIESVVDRLIEQSQGDVTQALSRLPIESELRFILFDDDATKADPSSEESIGTQIGSSTSEPASGFGESSRGRFRNLHPHAKGGLGQVFIALDRELNRQVAVKEIQSSSSEDDENQIRFVEEARITGNLEHPGIVPVYGLGSKKDGSPFYAMKFVRGNTLQQEIDQFHSQPRTRTSGQNMEFRRLLGQLISVCNAIEYAHGQNIIHRDLKPSNVIVGKYGETLVIDWGLAKILDEGEPYNPEEEMSEVTKFHPGSGSSAETAEGTVMGTLAYMSPEQALGDKGKVGKKSDVFSLGAVLYCILTGSKPLIVDSEVSSIMAVIHRKFEKPSRIDPAISPALEAICLKALSPEPSARYGSASLLADDLEKWMADEPVTAHRDSWLVRAARWSRKHKALVASAAALLLTATVATLIASVLINNEKNRVAAQKQVAERNFNLARKAVDDYLIEVSENTLLKSDLPGLKPLRRQLMTQALTYYETFLEERNEDDSVLGSAAEASMRVAQIQRDIGNAEEGGKAVDNALALNALALERNPDDREKLIDKAHLLQMKGEAVFREGEDKEALEIMEQVVSLRERILDNDKEELENQIGMASSLTWISNCQRRAGMQKQALENAKKAVAISEGFVTRFPDETRSILGHARALKCLKSILYHQGDPKMLEIGQRVVDQNRSLVKKHPTDIYYKVELASSISDHANGLHNQKKTSEAADNYLEAIKIFEPIASQNPSVSLYQVRMASAEMMYAQMALILEPPEIDKSQDYANRAADRLQGQIDQGRTQLRIIRDLAGSRYVLASVKASNDDFEGALKENQSVIKTLDLLKSKDPVVLFNTAATYASCIDLIDRMEESASRYKKLQSESVAGCVEYLRKAYRSGWNNKKSLTEGFGLKLVLEDAEFKKFVKELNATQ